MEVRFKQNKTKKKFKKITFASWKKNNHKLKNNQMSYFWI